MPHLDLNGAWKIRWTDGTRGRLDHANNPRPDLSRYFDAIVPGEVHLDLMRAGVIGDPAVGLNVLAARWVEECYWSYRRDVAVPADALEGRSWLVFEGLDLAARIVLNGEEIGRHANSFYPCRIETTGKLRAGSNLLVVHLDGGLFHVMDKPGEGYLQEEAQRLHKRHWLRKPQCQFGWDWSPRLINVGIHKPVRLEWTRDAARADQIVPLVTVSDDLAEGRVVARIFVEFFGDKPLAARLTLTMPNGGNSITSDVEIKPGMHSVETVLTVARPKLWWPVGHGEPHMYDLRITLEAGGAILCDRGIRIGFRRVRINQDPHPQGGHYYNVEINGRKIFCKGGNFVPADLIFARIDRARYAKLIDLALESNFNFLRIWGGGLYEADDFYELCDEKGILVWQEFIYACAQYPMFDKDFFADAKKEATWNVRRLASHPSLIVWCGNNELEVAAWHWGPYTVHGVPDHGFYHVTLPRLMAEEDPTRFYQASSPLSPPGIAPDADDTGDQHPWSIGFADTDFRKYRQMSCRFPNEGGILGPVSLPTLRACFPAGDTAGAAGIAPVGSFPWQVHDNSVDTWGEPSYPDAMISQWLGLDIRKMNLEEYAYWAGLVQGEGLREYCDTFRRRMFDNGSAIFWMYNDTWPAARSWTTVDYYLRRTPAFGPVKRAMAPVHIIIAREGDNVVVFGVNDTMREVIGELRFGVFTIAGGLPVDRAARVTLAPNASTRLASFPQSQWDTVDVKHASTAAFAVLSHDGKPLARNRLFLPFFKDLVWSPADVSVTLSGGRARFTSPTFAWGLCLDLDGETPLPDNFFDVYPGIEYSFEWAQPTVPTILRTGNLGGEKRVKGEG